MKDSVFIEQRAHMIIEQLRRQTLANGEPFMLYDVDLPSGWYYMEYPDGDIKIVTASHYANDFIVQEELSSEQVHDLRRRLELSPVFPLGF